MKGCIFDLDGTLTDTLESLTYSVQATLREMNLPEITSDQCRQFVGNGARKLVECSLIAAGDEKAERLSEGMELYGRIFDANCTYHVTPYEGIPELLKRLKGQEIKLAVLSNKPHRQTQKVIEEIFGTELFDYVQGQVEGMARKPDPSGVYCLLERMHIEKNECLYVGDSEVDITTGVRAGVKTIGVTWGFRSRDLLLEAGAQFLIDEPKELLSYA